MRFIELQRLPRRDQLRYLYNLPAGTVALWDNHHGKFGYHIDCNDLQRAGFRILRESKVIVDPTYEGEPVEILGIIGKKVK